MNAECTQLSLSSANGSLLKILDLSFLEPSATIGLHSRFGFLFENRLVQRLQLNPCPKSKKYAWKFLFSIENKEGEFQVKPIKDCEARKINNKENTWRIESNYGNFHLTPLSTTVTGTYQSFNEEVPNEKKIDRISLGIALGFFGISILLNVILKSVPIVDFKKIEPVLVSLKVEKQKPVIVPPTGSVLQATERTKKEQVVSRVINQNLGFLGLLGKKDIQKALGSGGNQGSGGEFLVGLGEGVKPTTVGNSGVQGLGGIGTKGAGGGAGGYGSSLASMATSNEIVLEGGLDRAVIQATIAKYLHEIRACYENGLARKPGLLGLVSVAFEISATGSVQSSLVSKSSLSDKEVESCITQRVQGWNFPKPVGGVVVKVNYPFLLRPAGGA